MLDLKVFVCPVFMAELWVGATEHLHQPPHKTCTVRLRDHVGSTGEGIGELE